MRPKCGGVGDREFPALTFIFYQEVIMKKTLKRIAAVLLVILAALIISYMVYTGGQLHA